MLGLRCCFSLVAASKATLIAVFWLLVVVSSLVAEHGLWGARALVVAGLNSCSSWALEHRLSSCSAWAQLLQFSLVAQLCLTL